MFFYTILANLDSAKPRVAILIPLLYFIILFIVNLINFYLL